MDDRENLITEKRTEYVASFVLEALKKYQENNYGVLPEQILIYRDGCGGETMSQKIIKTEVPHVAHLLD